MYASAPRETMHYTTIVGRFVTPLSERTACASASVRLEILIKIDYITVIQYLNSAY